MLNLVLEDEGQRNTFLTKYATHKGPASTLWTDLSETPGLKEHVPDLQITLQLATLTGNHVPLVDTLRRMRTQGEFSTFRDLARLGTAEWKQIITRPEIAEDQRVPPEIPGATAEDKAWVYAATLARVFEDVLPTEVLVHRIRRDEQRSGELRALLGNIVARDTSFDLARTPVRELVGTNPDLLAGVANPQLAIAQAEGVQRLFSLTPSYNDMKPLLDADLSSLTIAQMNQGTFVNSFKSVLGGTTHAAYVHERASYTAAATMNLVANYSPAFNALEMRVLQAPKPESVPDLERLFGSLDLCRCTHCRSVHGPAAYFAEILAFLAQRPQRLTLSDGSTVDGTAKDVLFERRPDLGDIELTCENTNTSLPCVDLVNEILEQVVSPFVPFALDGSLETTLNNRVVSTGLRAALVAHGHTLSPDAVVVIAGTTGGSWFITDHAVLYSIRKNSTSGAISVTSVGRQTKGRPRELNANPEHVNAAAYERLATALFPWTLPLNLWWQEARVYLSHLKVPRHELMQELHPQGPPPIYRDIDIATEHLGLTRFERQILTGGRQVRVASSGAIATLSGLLTVDGLTIADQDRVLVKDQSNATENGVYIAASGAWTREALPAGATAFLRVQQGTANTGTMWLAWVASDGALQASAVRPWEFWGLQEAGNQVRTFDPTAADGFVMSSLGWREALTHLREFLKRSGLTYEELNELLGTDYVMGGTPIRIESADPADLTTCDTSKLIINTLTTHVLGRARTIIRLWRKIGWTIPELDRAIRVLSANTPDVNARIDDALIVQLSHVQRLTSALGLSVGEVLTFWSNIDTRGPDSLYARLFQNPTVIRPVDPAFALAGGELAIVTSSPADATLSTHVPTIVAALGVTAPELAVLLSSAVSADLLNLANLSTLYRFTLLARGLNLPIVELVALFELAGVEPFDPAHTESAVLLVELAEKVRSSGFSIAELDYLLRHRTSDAVDVAPGDDAVAQVLTEMRAGLLKTQDETGLQADPEGELLRKKLALLKWHPESIEETVAHLTGSMIYTAPLPALPSGFVVPPDLAERVSHRATTGTLEVAGPLTSIDKQKLWDASTDAPYRLAVTQLFEAPRQFAAEQMKLFSWPAFSSDLAALPSGVVFSNELRGRIYFDAPARTLRFMGRMTPSERTLLFQSSSDATFQSAVQTLFDAAAAHVPEARNAFMTAADASDVFDRAAGSERIERVLTKLLGYLRRTLSAGLVTQSLSEALSLGVKAVEHLITRSVNALSAPGVAAVSDFLAPAFAESHQDVSITAAQFPMQFDTYRRLDKVAQITRKLALTPRQLEWLSQYGPAVPLRQAPWIAGAVLQTGWLDFNQLPTAATVDGRALFAAWLRLVDLRRVRDYFRRGENALSEVFALAATTDMTPAALRTALVQKVSERSGWAEEELSYLIGGNALNLSVPDDFRDEYGLGRLIACFKRLRRTGASAAQSVAWSRPEITAADARSIRQVVKAKYSEESWLDVAKPLRDELRTHQRRALVDYLVPRADASKGQFWTTADGLYAHFLIDVQMEPCFLTSRLKQAIGSVQLFVQRWPDEPRARTWWQTTRSIPDGGTGAAG